MPSLFTETMIWGLVSSQTRKEADSCSKRNCVMVVWILFSNITFVKPARKQEVARYVTKNISQFCVDWRLKERSMAIILTQKTVSIAAPTIWWLKKEATTKITEILYLIWCSPVCTESGVVTMCVLPVKIKHGSRKLLERNALLERCR